MSNTKRRAEQRKQSERRSNLIFAVVIAAAVLAIGFGVIAGGQDAKTDVSAAELITAAALDPCPTGVADATPIENGLPDQELECLHSDDSVNFSQLRGTPLLINVWGSWCPPCVEELPWLSEFSEAAAGKVQVLGVNVADEWNPAMEMLVATGVHFPSLFDPTNSTRATLMWSGTPITLFVSAEGEILYRHEGRLPDGDSLYLMVEEILGVSVADPTA